jgi:hypothetical protein
MHACTVKRVQLSAANMQLIFGINNGFLIFKFRISGCSGENQCLGTAFILCGTGFGSESLYFKKYNNTPHTPSPGSNIECADPDPDPNH